MGIALIGLKEDRLGVIANSVLTNPINDLVRVNASRTAFVGEVDRWVDMYQPDAIIAERFQTRGGGASMGKSIECISAMLGLLLERYELPVKLVVASQWKNKFQKRFGVDLKDIYKQIRVAPHALDACLIGCYGLEAGMGQDFEYTPELITSMAEKRSCLPLKRERK